MKTFLLVASSFNENSLNNFLNLLKKNFNNKQTIMIKINRFVVNKKIVTILKSPHVNKTAQEQFEKIKKSVQILLISKSFHKTAVIVKKVFNKLFTDIKLTISYLTNNNFNLTSPSNVLKIINFKFNSLKIVEINKNLRINKTLNSLYSKKKSINFQTYLKILNSHGEIFL